tara:strand:+ start:714 stop:2303 length:1590 start_codon:yes stop_codon:yes gene_type:complete
MSYKLSKKEIVAEILKSGKDPVYFINNYARISHPIDGLIPFKTYPYQADLLQDFNDYRFTVILKARQLGISTIAAAYVVWLMLFHRDKNILVMATKFKTASNLVKKVKAIMKNLPEWIIISEISIDNRSSFELSNGSQIQAASTSGDAGRSEALSLLVIDEAAHVENLDELWPGLYPTISTGGRVIALSTPKGVGNWFHKTYSGAEEGTNDFHPINLPWHAHPDRDQNWFDKETRNMSRREIAQELECNFNTSGESVIHPDDIAWVESLVCDPKYRTGFDRNMWIWEQYQVDSSYLLVADVARGDGADYSVFHIIKLETMEIVAEYQGKPSLDMYSTILQQAGKEYGNCLLVVENVGIGISVLEKLIDLQYPNLYYSIKGSHDFVDSYQGESNNSAVPGFTTSSKTRPLIVAKLEEFIRNKLIKIHSVRFSNELRTFIWLNGKPQAMRGYNDDLMMALAIACWVKDTALTVNKQDAEFKKACLNSIIKVDTKINTTIPGMQGYNRQEALDEKMFKAKEEHMKYSWLIKG